MASGLVKVTLQADTEIMARAIEEFGQKSIEHFTQGVMQMAEATMTLSKAAFVPVITGTLRSSGFVTELLPYPDGFMVDIGYGGAAAHYAAAVHFRPSNVGQGKNLYLTKPVRLMGRQGDQMLSRWMQRLWDAPQANIAAPRSVFPTTPGALSPKTSASAPKAKRPRTTATAPKLRKARAPRKKP